MCPITKLISNTSIFTVYTTMQKLFLFLNIHLGEHLQKVLFLQDKNAVFLWMESHNREKYVFKCIWIGVDVALEGLPCYDANLSIQGSLLDFCVN